MRALRPGSVVIVDNDVANFAARNPPDLIEFSADDEPVFIVVSRKERVARAICRARTGHPCAAVEMPHLTCGCGHWDDMTKYAQSAIEELK